MNIKIIESAGSGATGQQVLISYVCNETVAIDAGCLGLMTPLDSQRRIRHIFLSHSHIDHTASLPSFLDNVYVPGPESVVIHALPDTLDSLKRDFFNDRVWPDLLRLSRAETPFLRLQPLTPERPVQVDGLSITPLELNHVVPTVGFVIADAHGAVAIVSDTAPSERVWEALNALDNLRAVFLEASFPESMAWVAEKAMHLTPLLFRGELAKLRRSVPTIAVHLKPAYREALIEELHSLRLPQLEIGVPGAMYRY
ncbi:MAG: 3',5'-cyclic-nucleotide phosphodiesterase [Planctomycetales bacterium]